MIRISTWPAPQFAGNEIVWVNISEEVLEWLDETVGGMYRLEIIDNNSTRLRGAVCFESTVDATMFKLRWI